MVQGHGGRRAIRSLFGAALVLFGLFVLFGGLFVPLDVIIADPGIVPAPESWVAIWIVMLGLIVALWPARRQRADRR